MMSAASTDAPVASAMAGAASPLGVKRTDVGIAPTIESRSSARKPRPAAAAAEPVTVLPEEGQGRPAARPSHARAAIAAQPTTGIGSNRIAV